MLGAIDLYLFHEGTHRRLWEVFGSHVCVREGVSGTLFRVWAPHAQHVWVTGDFCGWSAVAHAMTDQHHKGVFELFIPGVQEGSLYKYVIQQQNGGYVEKADPYARCAEVPPGTASVVTQSFYVWNDAGWMEERVSKNWRRSPLCVYELHLGSWFKSPYMLNHVQHYREIAYRIVDHVKRCGFNAVEIMPVMEHPFTGSWGYQVCGYYAPTSRYGGPDDFRFLVDLLHQHGVAVILDWVPAHFPKDMHGLASFDGSCVYEYADPRIGEHPDWGTLVFDYSSAYVRNFLIDNALYWCQEFHADGIRVDAVASMLYRDYSRREGMWVANKYGGRENLEAVLFLQTLNTWILEECKGVFTVAEESTSWPGVTRDVCDGGLGFTFKWNMGWMHDSLEYFKRDPLYKKYHQEQLMFSMVYEYSEHFMMPLSHDEVVHGKGSLVSKMPGDEWQRRAHVRTLLAYQYMRPGKKLLFMGCELLQKHEWNHDEYLCVDEENTSHASAMMSFMGHLGRVYQKYPCLWMSDPDPEGFQWIDNADHGQSVLSWLRVWQENMCVVVMNLTPVPRENYRIGVPKEGVYGVVLNSDDVSFGGSGFCATDRFHAEETPMHGFLCSMVLTLPPLGVLVLKKVP